MTAPTGTVTKVRNRMMDLAATNPNLATSTALEEAVVNAVTKYGQDRPLKTVLDITGQTSPYLPIVGSGALLTGWLDGFSSIHRIEYPAAAVSANYVPTYLTVGDDWEYYDGPAIKYVRLKTIVPVASETFRVTYTMRPSHTQASDTLPAADLDAVCDLAAHYCCVALATKAAASSDPMLQADSVNHRDAQLKFKQQADVWLAEYNSKMGIVTGGEGSSAGSKAGASANTDWDQTFQSGLPFITHWGRRR